MQGSNSNTAESTYVDNAEDTPNGIADIRNNRNKPIDWDGNENKISGKFRLVI